MWWLPVIGWALVFIMILLYAWLSIAIDRYYANVDKAEFLGIPIPEEPWYVSILDWRKYFRR